MSLRCRVVFLLAGICGKTETTCSKEEKQRVRKELALDQSPNPDGCGTCVTRRVALDVVSEEGFGLPREPGCFLSTGGGCDITFP